MIDFSDLLKRPGSFEVYVIAIRDSPDLTDSLKRSLGFDRSYYSGQKFYGVLQEDTLFIYCRDQVMIADKDNFITIDEWRSRQIESIFK